MKRLLVLGILSYQYFHILPSQEQLLRHGAIFRTVHVRADTVDYDRKYCKEEVFAEYVGMPVFEKITIGRHQTPAIRTLVGFLGRTGKKYRCKPFPGLQKNEVLLISSDFDENIQNFLMQREQRSCLCWCQSRCIFFEIGQADLEEKKEGSHV